MLPDCQYVQTQYPIADLPIEILHHVHTAEEQRTYSYVQEGEIIGMPFDREDTRSETHYHASFELVCVLEGEMNLTLQGRAYSATPSKLFFINPYECHQVSRLPGTAIVEYITIIGKSDLLLFTNKQYQNLLVMLESGAVHLPNCIDSTSKHFSVLQNIVHEIVKSAQNRQFGWELYLVGQLHCLFGTLFATLPDLVTPSDEVDFFSKVTRYINQNLGSKITLSQIAAYIGYNPKYFCRLFKRCTHATFNEYVTGIRIERAKTLLLGNVSVTRTAYDCGFEDLSYFSKKFKQYTGVSPQVYKEKHHTNKL